MQYVQVLKETTDPSYMSIFQGQVDTLKMS